MAFDGYTTRKLQCLTNDISHAYKCHLKLICKTDTLVEI